MTSERQDGSATVLHWAGKLLSSDDLRRHLNGHREIVVPMRAIVTPLAVDELRGRGVKIRREEAPAKATTTSGLAFAQEYPDAAVLAAIQAVQRDGMYFAPLTNRSGADCDWARQLAECTARGECQACVIFCSDAGLVCCVANKIAGVRAAAVATVAQTGRALTNLGANLLAVEMPGRTYFEIRQILRTLAQAAIVCPPELANTLKELERAHR